MLGYSYYYTNIYGAFKGFSFVGYQKYTLFASFIAFVSSIFSIVFSFAILCVSSLTMQKQKRLVNTQIYFLINYVLETVALSSIRLFQADFTFLSRFLFELFRIIGKGRFIVFLYESYGKESNC